MGKKKKEEGDLRNDKRRKGGNGFANPFSNPHGLRGKGKRGRKRLPWPGSGKKKEGRGATLAVFLHRCSTGTKKGKGGMSPGGKRGEEEEEERVAPAVDLLLSPYLSQTGEKRKKKVAIPSAPFRQKKRGEERGHARAAQGFLPFPSLQNGLKKEKKMEGSRIKRRKRRPTRPRRVGVMKGREKDARWNGKKEKGEKPRILLLFHFIFHRCGNREKGDKGIGKEG